MGAALVAGDGVDLVDDDRLHLSQHFSPAGTGEQEIQGLRGGDDQARTATQHLGPLRRRRVASAHGYADGRRREAELNGHRRDLSQRPLEILGDVHRQRLERRDVHRAGGARHVLPGRMGSIQRVDRDQEAGERLARARWRRDQCVQAAGDQRPAAGLRLGRSIGKAAREPLADGRVEPGQARNHARMLPHGTCVRWCFRTGTRVPHP